MIIQLSGRLVEIKEQSLAIETGGITYEVMVPVSVLGRITETQDSLGYVHLIIYHYMQISQSSATPVMIGFINEIERDFFLQFIKVSGIGPRGAVRALNQPIAQITQAIDNADVGYLKTLPGIGMQRAKEIVAKLQGKIGKFGLIQDHSTLIQKESSDLVWEEEALSVLLQLQYKRQEALEMIERALKKKDIKSTEQLLEVIYEQSKNLT